MQDGNQACTISIIVMPSFENFTQCKYPTTNFRWTICHVNHMVLLKPKACSKKIFQKVEPFTKKQNFVVVEFYFKYALF